MSNYSLKLSFRSMWKHRVFTFINVFGLSVALACVIVIGLYTFQEYSFDRFHPNHSKVFRINKLTSENGQQSQRNGITPGPLAPALLEQLPVLENASRFRPWFSDILVSYDTISHKLKDVSFADASFLSIFNFPLITGNKASALNEPFTAVITESVAKLYFNNDNPVGKKITTLNNIQVTITGVLRDLPVNSSIRFPILISWSTLTAPSVAGNFSWMDNWNAQVTFTFVQLKPLTDPFRAGSRISAILHEHLQEKEYQYSTYLQALDDIHLNSSGVLYADQFHTRSKSLVFTLAGVAIFILLIACFNFINLTTAGALSRAKETGIQKLLGASLRQIRLNFFKESVLLCSSSMLLAILISLLLIPLFNTLANTSLTRLMLLEPKGTILFVSLLVCISLIAGIYPAFFLARFPSSDIFKNTIRMAKNPWLRKTMVIIQFTLAVLLIVGTMVVNRQMNYLVTKDLGFDKEQMVILKLNDTGILARSTDFSNSLQQNPSIISVSASNSIPGENFNGYGVIPEGHTLNEHILANVLETDAAFASNYHLKLVSGRYFSPSMPTDTGNAVVINEAMAKTLQWNNPIGKQFEVYEETKGHVIGVIKDFNFASLHDAVQPLAIILRNNPLCLSIRVKPGSMNAALAFMEKTWKKYDQRFPFEYSFLDEQLNHYYQSEVNLLQVLGIFTGLAIAIACMGLLGLCIYTVRQRMKEIGIRKVLGATVLNIASIISKEFLLLVGLAIIIGFPVAWWICQKWLQDFAYRVRIDWTIFLLAALSLIGVTIGTIGYNAIRAALINPVRSLKEP